MRLGSNGQLLGRRRRTDVFSFASMMDDHVTNAYVHADVLNPDTIGCLF